MPRSTSMCARVSSLSFPRPILCRYVTLGLSTSNSVTLDFAELQILKIKAEVSRGRHSAHGHFRDLGVVALLESDVGIRVQRPVVPMNDEDIAVERSERSFEEFRAAELENELVVLAAHRRLAPPGIGIGPGIGIERKQRLG